MSLSQYSFQKTGLFNCNAFFTLSKNKWDCHCTDSFMSQILLSTCQLKGVKQKPLLALIVSDLCLITLCPLKFRVYWWNCNHLHFTATWRNVCYVCTYLMIKLSSIYLSDKMLSDVFIRHSCLVCTYNVSMLHKMSKCMTGCVLVEIRGFMEKFIMNKL